MPYARHFSRQAGKKRSIVLVIRRLCREAVAPWWMLGRNYLRPEMMGAADAQRAL
jgi:hypothetical protein